MRPVSSGASRFFWRPRCVPSPLRPFICCRTVLGRTADEPIDIGEFVSSVIGRSAGVVAAVVGPRYPRGRMKCAPSVTLTALIIEADGGILHLGKQLDVPAGGRVDLIHVSSLKDGR